MFGPGDSFLHTILALLRKIPVPSDVWPRPHRLQPVYVGDVAQAIARVLERTERRASRSLGGPHIDSYQELLRAVAGTGGRLPRIRRIGEGRAEDQVASARIQAERPPSPKTIVIVKRPDGSGCVGRPVVKCREGPSLFSAVNPRSLDPRVR